MIFFFHLVISLDFSSLYHYMYLIYLQGRNADALALYFGEDPARCPFEQGETCIVFLFSPAV